MTQTLIGIDYEGVAAVKITKGDLDPITTNDNTPGAFLYNSKWANQIRLGDFENPPYYSGIYNWPPGTDQNTFLFRAWNSNEVVRYFYRRNFFTNISYQIPLYTVLPKRLDGNGYYKSGRTVFYTYGYEDRGEVVSTVDPAPDNGQFGWKLNYRTNVGAGSYQNIPDVFAFRNSYTTNTTAAYVYQGHDVIFWNLPGDEAGISDAPPLTPVPGQETILINSSGLKVAKPGYDVNIATGTQLAFDSNMRPLKIIAANDIEIPVGTSVYNLPIVAPANTVCDIHFYTGGTLYYPHQPTQSLIGANWIVSGSQIIFENPNAACRARFMVLAFDESSQTSGNNDVLRQFDVGGQNVVQFLKPGAGANPSFADIVLDSRWPAIKLLAEGSFGIASGAQTNVVNINTAGYFPIVRYMTLHGAYAGLPGGGDLGYSKAVKPPKVSRFRLRSPTGGVGWTDGGDSSYAEINGSQVIFRTWRGNPIRATFANQEAINNNTITWVYPESEMYGIRYYVFGIPTP